MPLSARTLTCFFSANQKIRTCFEPTPPLCIFWTPTPTPMTPRFSPMLALWLLFVFFCPVANAQSGLFDSDEVLELVLEFDAKTFLADRGGNPVYHKAKVLWGKDRSIDVEIQARGRFRRDPLVCDWPPMKVNFPKKLTKDTPFEKQNVLKLVTRCKEQEAVIREYYIYKMYNLVSERSFRVRMLRITYRDAKGTRPDETGYAFFIEDDSDLAKRLGATVDDGDYNNEQMQREQQTLVHVFNYMIANRDFDVALRQNLEILKDNETGTPYAVPYDFDWSGLVEASYTAGLLDDKSMYEQRQRFKAICRNEAEIQAAIQRLREVKPLIWKLYEGSTLLSKNEIDKTLNLLDSFYKRAGKKKFVLETFVDKCS